MFGSDSPQFEKARKQFGSAKVGDSFNFEALGKDSVGGYYAGRRDKPDAPKVDAAVLRMAHDRGMTVAELHDWADSKNGRYFADAAFDGSSPIDQALATFGPGALAVRIKKAMTSPGTSKAALQAFRSRAMAEGLDSLAAELSAKIKGMK